MTQPAQKGWYAKPIYSNVRRSCTSVTTATRYPTLLCHERHLILTLLQRLGDPRRLTGPASLPRSLGSCPERVLGHAVARPGEKTARSPASPFRKRTIYIQIQDGTRHGGRAQPAVTTNRQAVSPVLHYPPSTKKTYNEDTGSTSAAIFFLRIFRFSALAPNVSIEPKIS